MSQGPTWSALKIVFLLLGVTLAAMLALAFSSSDFMIFGHVLLLIIITGVLFLLLNRSVRKLFDSKRSCIKKNYAGV